MPADSMPLPTEASTEPPAHTALIPTVLIFVAGAAVVLLLTAWREPMLVDEIGSEAVTVQEPTPYSAAHARVMAQPGEPEEQPPTF